MTHKGQTNLVPVVFNVTPELAERLVDLVARRGADMDAFGTLMIRSFTRAPTIYSLEDKLGFGKYHGERCEDVIRGDPSYIEWLLRQDSKTFKLGQDGLDLLETIRDQD